MTLPCHCHLQQDTKKDVACRYLLTEPIPSDTPCIKCLLPHHNAHDVTPTSKSLTHFISFTSPSFGSHRIISQKNEANHRGRRSMSPDVRPVVFLTASHHIGQHASALARTQNTAPDVHTSSLTCLGELRLGDIFRRSELNTVVDS
jgi:hypothetical protein